MPYNNTTQQNTLIERVEYRCDQVTARGQTVPLNRPSVYQELEESSRSVLRRAPREAVYPAALDGTAELEAAKSLSGMKLVLPLPAGFLRFIRLQLADWLVPVDELIPVGTSLYRLQANQYAAADLAHPMAVLVPNFTSLSKQALEAYPGKNTIGSVSSVTLFAYVGETAPETMPDDLMDAMLWDATGRVLQNTKQHEGAAKAFEAAERALVNLRFSLTGEEKPSE